MLKVQSIVPVHPCLASVLPVSFLGVLMDMLTVAEPAIFSIWVSLNIGMHVAPNIP